MKKMFLSTTYGELDLLLVREAILSYMRADPTCGYRIIIGTDSSEKIQSWDFITAIVVHRIGKGGIYFWHSDETRSPIYKQNGDNMQVKHRRFIKERIYREAAISLETADDFMRLFKNDGISKFEVEIHVDVGNFGESRKIINEVVGMIRGSGYICKTKPDSYGASKIADRHT